MDLETYASLNPLDDAIWLRFVVGPEDGDGEESFDVLACTPIWLSKVVAKQGPRVGRHHLIVEKMDLSVAVDFIRARFERTDGPDWTSVAEQLARIGYWEFEDYQE